MNQSTKSILQHICIIMCLIFMINNSIKAQTLNTTQSSDELKLGLVLSGGGAKGFAHIGVLKVFEEENIPVTLIVGNSIGTIVGALYSLGYSAQDIEDFTKRQNWEALLTDGVERRYKSRFKQDFENKYFLKLGINKGDKKLSFPSGLIAGNNILNVFCGITADLNDSIDFTELPIPFSCVAYNLETGKEEILNSGYLAKAIMSSMAFPGVFSPVEFNDMKLLDGGIINNFPIDVAKDMGADILIGVDLKQPEGKSPQFESITTIFKEIVYKIEEDVHNKNVELADIVINPKLDGIATFDFKENVIDSIIKKGEMAAREQLPRIKKLIANKNIKQNNSFEEKREKEKEWLITDIRIPSKYKFDDQFITSRLNIEKNKRYTIAEIEKATERVFAYSNFEMVTYKLQPNSDGYILELVIEDRKDKRMMLGGALNTVDVAAFYANFARLNYSNFLSLITLDAKIAVNPQLRFIMETHRLSLSAVGLEVNARYNKLNYYHKGKRIGKMDVGSAAVDLYTYRRFKEVGEFGFGLKRTYSSTDDYSSDLSELFEIRSSGFSTSLYGYFSIDSRDEVSIPNKGIYLNTKFAVLENKGGFSNLIPLLDFELNSITSMGSQISLLANLHHRSIFNTSNYPLSIANYSSNYLNAYTDDYFPVLGQAGISFLEPISTLGELGVRINMGQSGYITPRVQALLQFDKWSNIEFSNLKWSGGLTYQKRTRLGPIDFTLGLREMFKGFNIYGGIGYQF